MSDVTQRSATSEINAAPKKPNFTEWLSEKNITFIIVSVLLVYALEKFAKNMHNDLVTPTFHKCVAAAGLQINNDNKNPKPRKTAEKIFIHVLELVFSIVILFLLSRFVFGHAKKPQPTPAVNKLCACCKVGTVPPHYKESDVIVVEFT